VQHADSRSMRKHLVIRSQWRRGVSVCSSERTCGKSSVAIRMRESRRQGSMRAVRRQSLHLSI
jgi:hypothetical protein